ncbi:winged helix-turn-helix domain-containing protein [Kitasatospora sp. NPDC049285]|uniref:winged helix-turn-helix domain-containing protein n=1 Tax=Kitasatospora sp. NPDC049285 TaxID=3157096 RepID=UPI00342B0FF9
MSYVATAATPVAPSHAPHLRAVPNLPADHARRDPQPAGRFAPEQLLAGLPEGATVVAALPQGLLAQFGAVGKAPLVGYVVVVPAEPAASEPAPPAPAARTEVPGRGIAIDVERRNAYVDGELLDLTYLEFELLAHLTGHPHRVHTRDHLVHTVWGYGHVGDGRTVDVHVARLRRKLGADYRDSIVTVRRVGYKYAPPVN